MKMASSTVDIEAPRYDQGTYKGRVLHFLRITNPFNICTSKQRLQDSKQKLEDYKSGKLKLGKDVSEEELWEAKYLRDSAFHPDTGDLQFFVGRMAFQVPGNIIVVGGMTTFYKSTPAILFWQWVNQTFNCIVNYTNRNASIPLSNTQLIGAYLAACSASMVAALGLNRLVARKPAWQRGLMGRLVPFGAVVIANCFNIPLMRQESLQFF
ncbi:sideroflexin-1-3-like [Zophobas morio]|uniref:sideroflexin-1-3-like n=1 Tax=Zophobas morio TaxID=2755281 RepID=UPI00308303F5